MSHECVYVGFQKLGGPNIDCKILGLLLQGHLQTGSQFMETDNIWWLPEIHHLGASLVSGRDVIKPSLHRGVQFWGLPGAPKCPLIITFVQQIKDVWCSVDQPFPPPPPNGLGFGF